MLRTRQGQIQVRTGLLLEDNIQHYFAILQAESPYEAQKLRRSCRREFNGAKNVPCSTKLDLYTAPSRAKEEPHGSEVVQVSSIDPLLLLYGVCDEFPLIQCDEIISLALGFRHGLKKGLRQNAGFAPPFLYLALFGLWQSPLSVCDLLVPSSG